MKKINSGNADVKSEGRYFGTDGFRGEANRTLTATHAFLVGRFLGRYFSRGDGRARIVIGKDTRRSSYMLEYALASGIAASGADAYTLHVTTTPSVSFVTAQDGFDCGIMITASHNPYTDNGIKLINRLGEKLDGEVVSLLEDYLDRSTELSQAFEDDIPLALGENIGFITDYISGRNRYVAYLISLATHSYKNLRIGIDAANGAAFSIAGAVFGALGAKVELIGTNPDGTNINRGVGSTDTRSLEKLVKEKGLDIGFAFDGDADRCIAVNERGEVVDGDAITYILAKSLSARGMLNKNTVALTVMSNSGFVNSLKAEGIDCIRTPVGDRFVYEAIKREELSLGGEQSGHIIIKKYATTGDGILTAIMLCEELCEKKRPLSALTEGLCTYPQKTVSIEVKDRDMAISDARVTAARDEAEKLLFGEGRILLRKSGTQNVIRIMAEAKTEAICNEITDKISRAIYEGGHALG